MSEQENAFINAWQHAGPTLDRMRKTKLSQLDESAGLRGLGAYDTPSSHLHGLAIMQAWFTKLRIKQLTQEVALKSELSERPTRSS